MIEEFAKYLSLNVWDWIAVLVSLCSIIIAFISLMIAKHTLAIAKLTLKSQRQTEKNTLPIININTQSILFNELIVSIYDTHISLIALRFLLRDEANLRLSKHVLKSLALDGGLVHSELFYNNPSVYEDVIKLQKTIKEYNMNLAVVNDYLYDNHDNLNKRLIEQYFKMLLLKQYAIVLIWITVISTIFSEEAEKVFGWMKEKIEKDGSYESRIIAPKYREIFKNKREKYEQELSEIVSSDPFPGIFSIEVERDIVSNSMKDYVILYMLEYYDYWNENC